MTGQSQPPLKYPSKETLIMTRTGILSHTPTLPGSSVYTALSRLLTTLLVLKLLSVRFPGQFPLKFHPKVVVVTGIVDPIYKAQLERAVTYAVTTDQSYPSLCMRLELGYNWASTIEDILYDSAYRA